MWIPEAKQKSKHVLVVLLGISMLTTALYAQDMDEVIDTGVQRGEISQKHEQEIDKVDKLVKEKQQVYQGLLKENEGLGVYIKQLNKQIENQELEEEKMASAIVQSAQMERQIVPLMLNMIAALQESIKLDLPFRKAERSKRLAQLEQLIDRSDVSVAEKYRKVLEMYQNEIDYGRTIEAYREQIVIDGKEQQVDVLRIGRIAMYYRSLDGEKVASWQQESAMWQELDGEYKSKLEKAIRIAREQAAPELIKVPLSIPRS